MDVENKEIILIGDFNCNSNPKNSRTSSQTDKLKDIVTTHKFKQLITAHTRITDSSASLIDLAFTNKPGNIVKSGVEHVGISDHSLIFIQRKISIRANSQK
jgi:endonuclease/exonuclease/phosphatase family metal-dependent hydrolase